MTELWDTREERDAALVKRRREGRNRQTYWAAFAAVIVAWIVTTFGAAATVEDSRRADVFAQMGGVGLVLVVGTIVMVVVVGLVRALNERLVAAIQRQVAVTRSVAAYRALIVGGLLLLAASCGTLVVQFWQIPGTTAWETGLVVGLVVAAVTTAIFFAVAPAERRLEVTVELTAETIELRRLAQFSPGEVLILDRLDDMHVDLERRAGSAPTSREDTSVVTDWSWCDWWANRPSRVRRTTRA